MANASFTRDEVILALDVLYFAGNERLSKDSNRIIDLCALLQSLPIVPDAVRPPLFRTENGVSNQLMFFRRSMETGIKNSHLGEIFLQVAAEYENRHDELHQIAEAIRRNVPYYTTTFGDQTENDAFPEGALLNHLHRIIEARDSNKLTPGKRCEICQIDTVDIYPSCPSLMTMHLMVPITALDGKKRYSASEFITVCPNCHTALHRRRPWLTKENCGDLLR